MPSRTSAGVGSGFRSRISHGAHAASPACSTRTAGPASPRTRPAAGAAARRRPAPRRCVISRAVGLHGEGDAGPDAAGRRAAPCRCRRRRARSRCGCRSARGPRAARRRAACAASTATVDVRPFTVSVTSCCLGASPAHLRSWARAQSASSIAAADVGCGRCRCGSRRRRARRRPGRAGDRASAAERIDAASATAPAAPARPPWPAPGSAPTPLRAIDARGDAPARPARSARPPPTIAKLPWVRANSTNACPPAVRADADLGEDLARAAARSRTGRGRTRPPGRCADPRSGRRTSSASSASDHGRQLGGRDRRGRCCRRPCRCCGSARCATYPSASASSGAADRDLRRVLGRRLADHRADHQRVALEPDPSQLLDAAQVDQVARLGQPEVHQRDEALPAREHPRLVVGVRRQQLEGLGDARRSGVLERWRFHSDLLVGARRRCSSVRHGFDHGKAHRRTGQILGAAPGLPD